MPKLSERKCLNRFTQSNGTLKKTTINGNQILANVKADKAHLLSQGENIIIAVIDDGTDIDNPEFNIAGKVVSSRDIFTNSNDPRPKYSDENHGTATAGVATAFGINASGVAPKAKLMAIRNSSNLGSIKEATAFKWAVDHGADIISCSWGPEDGDWWDPNDPKHTMFIGMADSTALAIEDAVTRGRNGNGCVIFFAAGNGNEDVQFDGYASYDKVIAVAASNDRNKRSVYSDFGDKIWCCFPSGDIEHQPFNHPSPLTTGIYTTDRRGSAGYNNQFDYCDDFGGTSSSCPGVAGIAALILSANSELTWLQVKEILKDSCEKIDTANGQYDSNGYSKFYGYGKPDAEKAVNKALLLKNNQAPQLKIISALVNPTGSDRGKEKISIKNNSATSVNLTGWKIQVKTKKQNLSGNIGRSNTEN
ncbi:MAG: S8 family serine peptidase [Ignavibacteria bacterium]|nr:S8 family serine peptidase [Ignavibacteria bacterium]